MGTIVLVDKVYLIIIITKVKAFILVIFQVFRNAKNILQKIAIIYVQNSNNVSL